MVKLTDLKNITEILKKFPKYLDGKESILYLKEKDYNWKQLEWIGWFFECWCKENLKLNVGNTYGKTIFDANFMGYDFDYKAHCCHNFSGKETPILITNDLEATKNTIEEHGSTYLIVANLEPIPDDNGLFKLWHDTLKGSISKYCQDGIKNNRRSRKRKKSAICNSISIYEINNDTFNKYFSIFKQGKNSNGKERQLKVKVNINNLTPIIEVKLGDNNE